MVNNNHFNTLNVKIKQIFIFPKGDKKDFKKKCESTVRKTWKWPQFYGRLFNIYSINTLFAIKEYLERNIYPEEITPLDCQKTKKIEKGILEKLWEKIKGLD